MIYKYHTKPIGDSVNSTATIVADKINLLSTSSPNSYKMTDRKALIDDKELEKVIQSAYKLPYGEKLVEFLQVFVEAFMNHTHDYSMLPPNPYWTTSLMAKKADMLDNKTMLSDTVRIN